MTTGIFVTFEGGDGVGKSTQINLLANHLRLGGHAVTVTREPGGSSLGEQIRELVLHSRSDISARAEALLYAADRAHNVASIVRPALERGEVVLQDRYLDSSIAYQGVGRGLGRDEIRDISLWAADGLLPSLTILLDLEWADAKARLARQVKPFDRFESQAQEFHDRVRDAFRELADAEPHRFFVLDASRPIEDLSTAIFSRVSELLANLNG